jgi:hypothetical protein
MIPGLTFVIAVLYMENVRVAENIRGGIEADTVNPKVSGCFVRSP